MNIEAETLTAQIAVLKDIARESLDIGIELEPLILYKQSQLDNLTRPKPFALAKNTLQAHKQGLNPVVGEKELEDIVKYIDFLLRAW